MSFPSTTKPWMKYYDEAAVQKEPFDGLMYEYLRICNGANQGSIAINYFGKTVTYAELFAWIDQCALALTNAGVQAGESIAVSLLPMPEAAVLLYAANKIGATFVAIPITDSAESIIEKLTKRSCRVLFASPSVTGKVQNATSQIDAAIVSIPLWTSAPFIPRLVMKMKSKGSAASDKDWKRFLASGLSESNVDAVSPAQVIQMAEPAVVVYTGGTTGKPKGVPVSNRAANTVASYYSCGVFELDPCDRFLDVMPPFLAYGLFAGIHMPLCLGMELVMCPDVRPDAFPAHIFKYKPEHVTVGPGHLDALMADSRAASMDFSFLKTAGYGGDSASRDWEERFSSFILERGAPRGVMKGYGMTEVAGPFCSSTHSCSQMIPFPGSEVMICDTQTSEELAYGQEGEICVSGMALMDGYLDVPSNEAGIMFERNGIRWMRTGDLGRIDGNGHFEILGRLKRLLWAVGNDGIPLRVYPVEIEEVLAQHPCVSQCAVVGKKCGDGYEIEAFVVPEHAVLNSDLETQLGNHCSTLLSAHAFPKRFHLVDSLPLTPVGKVDYRKLEAMAAKGERS